MPDLFVFSLNRAQMSHPAKASFPLAGLINFATVKLAAAKKVTARGGADEGC